MPLSLWPSYFNICIAAFVFVVTVGIAYYSWLHRNLPSARSLLALALAGALWALSFALELINRSLAIKILFENIQYLALSIILVYYLVFTFSYTRNQNRISIGFGLLLMIEPVINQIVIWMDPSLHWFRASIAIETGGLDYPGVTYIHYGPWFWINLTYTLFFFVIILIILLISYFTSPKWSRNRLWYLIISIFIPLVAATFSIPSWLMQSHDYLLILAIGISLIVLAWGVFRIRLLDIVPIARETLLDQMHDAFLVLDASNQVIDLNQAARSQFKASPAWIGKSFSEVMPEFADITLDKHEITPKEKQIKLHLKNEIRTFELKISPLQNDNFSLAGWSIIFHDITSHVLEEEKLRLAQGEAQKAYRKSERHQQDLDTIRRITETLNQSKTLRQALTPALESIALIAGQAEVWVLLKGTEKASNRMIYYQPGEIKTPLHFSLIDPGLPDCFKMVLEGELTTPCIFDCNCAKSLTSTNFSNLQHYAFPLQVGSSKLGVLNIALANPPQLDEDSLELILTLCNSLSVVVERVSLFKAEQEQKRLAIAQQRITSTLTSTLNLDNLLDLLLDQVSHLIPFDSGNVMLLNETTAYVARQRGYEFLGPDLVKDLLTWKFPIETTMNIAHIVKNKQPMIIEDTATEPGWVKIPHYTPLHSWLGAPILINDKVVAIFSLEKREKNFYTPNHAERLNLFCTSAALAYQNANYFEEINKRIREFESLHNTMQDITSKLDLKLLLHEITKRSIALLDSTSGILGLINHETEALEVVVGISSHSEFAGEVIPIGKGAMGKVAQTRKPMVIDDYSAWAGRYDRLVAAFPHAVIQVPLIAGDEFLGVIGVGDENPTRKYTEEDVRLLSLFAQQATIGIRNARLYSEAKHQADEANTLRQASAIVASTLDQKEALPLILNQLAKVVPFDSASVLLEKEGELEVVEGKGFKDTSPLLGIRIALDSSQPGAMVYQNQKPLIVHNMPIEYPQFNEINRLQIQSWIGVPLIYGSRVIGILALDSLEPNRYNEEHARLATAFAGHVAIALENVRLYQSALQSTKRLTALYKLSQHISSNLQPDEVYHAIHKATKDLMPCDSFILSLLDEKTKMINDVYFIDHGIPQKLSSRPLGVGLATKAINERRTIFYNHFNIKMIKRTNAVLVGEDKDESVVRSFIIVPLKLGKNVKGILSTQSYSAGAYTEEDKETLELLASHAVIALENAHLFSEVQELAITDSLTKIFNRRRFFELAEGEFDRSRRYDRPLSVIMMDIDHFKRVNDSYGHAAGDQVLETLAQLVQKSLREVDVFARYGGEEFVVMLPETTSIEAQLTAERVRQIVARTPFNINASTTVTVTISFGVVELDETCRNTEELLDRSDQALYHSKRSGRNRVSIWSPTTQPKPPANPD